MNEELFECRRCKVPKPASEHYYYGIGKSAGKRRAPCKQCHKEKTKQWQKDNPEEHRYRLFVISLKTYGLTPESYKALEEAQGYVCKICENPCGSKNRLSVDHDHVSGQVRGLLCANCNHGLGHFRDSTVFLSRAVDYLKRVI